MAYIEKWQQNKSIIIKEKYSSIMSSACIKLHKNCSKISCKKYLKPQKVIVKKKK